MFAGAGKREKGKGKRNGGCRAQPMGGGGTDANLIRLAFGQPPFQGSAGPFSLKTVHWTVFRALEPFPIGEG